MLDRYLNLIPIMAADKKQAPTRLLLLRDGDIGWAGLKGVELTPESARNIIALFEKHGAQLVIDYHHKTDQVVEGRADKAPAAGWIKKLEYVEGDGLYADDIEWTQEAAAEILAKQYKYISPVILAYKDDKAIASIDSVALTNKPRTIDARELLAEAAEMRKETELMEKKELVKLCSEFLKLSAEDVTPAIDAETKMLADFVEALRAAGVTIEETATMTDILAAAIQFVASVSEEAPIEEELPPEEAEAKAKADAEAAKQAAEKAAKAGQYDALHARVKVAEEELASIKAEKRAVHVEELIQGQIEANKLNPNDEDALTSARTLAEKDEEAFTKLFATIQPYGPNLSMTRGTTSGAGSCGRQRIIADASKEYDANPKAACGAAKRFWVDEVLKEEGELVLTDAEVQKLEGVQA